MCEGDDLVRPTATFGKKKTLSLLTLISRVPHNVVGRPNGRSKVCPKLYRSLESVAHSANSVHFSENSHIIQKFTKCL